MTNTNKTGCACDKRTILARNFTCLVCGRNGLEILSQRAARARRAAK